MFTTGIRTNPSKNPKMASRKAVTSQTIAPGVLSADTADTIDVMVSYGQDRYMVWRLWITMLPPTQSMAAVPTIEISFSTVGIAMTSQRPNTRTLLRVAALLMYRPISSTLTRSATVP